VHNNDNLCELWHKRMGHFNHMLLLILREIVTGLLEFSIEQHGVSRGCMLWQACQGRFPKQRDRSKGILGLVHLDVCELM
jgi:hypothetical protein